jgi:ABC-type transport system substrate-binding protein
VTLLPPGVLGYDERLSLGPTFDIPRAKALLDMFGYVDRDGDGWRDLPDGAPLVFRTASQPDQLSKQFTILWKKGLDAIGVRFEVEVAPWPELRKKSKQGLLTSWQLSWGADYPDGENFYQLLYGPNCGISNDGCFELAEYDRLYEEAGRLPPGPERTAVYQRMARLVAAYAPMKTHVHRRYNFMLQPWVRAWRKHPILHDTYKYADIDLERRARDVR